MSIIDKLEALKEKAVSDCDFPIAAEIRDCIDKVKKCSRFVPSSQLPEGMEHCTILFKNCPNGHGRLLAANWVDHGCQTCVINSLTKTISELNEIKEQV